MSPKISTLVDSFTAGSISTTTWGSITPGTASLDTVNNKVSLAVPTTSGTTNTFGTTTVYDATESALYAAVTVGANGNGAVTTALKIAKDAGNHVQIRVAAGVFGVVLTTGGVPAVTGLGTYNPHAHRWWRIAETATHFVISTSPDGLNWTTGPSLAYTWPATAVTVAFTTSAGATEAAGNAAVLAHVNTRTGGVANPNWPTVEYGAGLAWGANGGTMPLDLYVDVSGRTQGDTTTSRGRQNELDQVRAGEGNDTFANPDGVLDPASTTSPFAGHVDAFQPHRIRAQWPPTPNLLTPGIATGGDVGGIALGTITPSTALDLLTDTDTTGGTVTASASAWAGGTVTAFAVPVGTAAGQRIVHTAQAAVTPGQPYTVQLRVRNVTAATSLQVQPFVAFTTTAGTSTPSTYNYGSTVTLTGAAAPGWTYLAVSGTAPANAYGMDVGVAAAATVAANCTVQSDGWQLEHGTTASPWGCPGWWYPLYAGFTEDIPSTWSMSGTYGTINPSTADAFSLLSQLTLQDALTMELNAKSPRYLYTLADPAEATAYSDTTGNFPALPPAASKYGPGLVAAGTAITAASPTGVYTGATGTVVTLTNTSPGANSTSPASFLNLGATGILGPQGTTFSRILAFRYTGPTPAVEVDLWSAIDNHHGANPGSQLRAWIDTSGHVNVNMSSFANGGVTLTSTTPVADSNWHLLVFGQDAVGGSNTTFFLSVDGAFTNGDASGGGGHGSPFFPTGIVSDAVGAFVDGVVGNTTNFVFKGDLSYVGEMAQAYTATDCTNLYTAWRSAAAGESTGARYARILRYAGYTGPTSIQTGQTTSMGPANTDGQDVVTALQGVVDTENGAHFIAADGTPTFLGRAARYDALTPAIVFGERADLGEWPYEDVQTVWDTTHLGNKIAVTQESTSQVFYAVDLPSVAAYFPRTLARTVNTSSDLEAQDAANYLKSRYRKPLMRVSSMTLHPAANPALWPALLGMELSTRSRVMRRPPGLTASQMETFVENIAWTLTDDADATCVLQMSPADTTLYGLWAAWHTTLATSPAAGASTITVNASQDNINPLDRQLASGQQLTLGQNTTTAETVTVLSVGNTSSGWTSAVITLTAPTINAHTAGDIVCEPLPAGVTDPITYDSAAAFDAVAYAY